MRRIAMAVVAASLAAACAALGPGDFIEGRADRDVPIYAPDDRMRFSFSAHGFEGLDLSAHRFAWTRDGDDGIKEAGESPADRVLVVETSLDRPGFVRIRVELRGPDGGMVRRESGERDVFFDGGACVEPLKIRARSPRPEDFDAFWERRRKELDAVPWRGLAKETPLDSGREDVDLYAVSVPCAGERPSTGFLSVPRAARDGRKYPARILFAGYGASWKPAAKPAPGRLPADWISFEMNAHGCELMREPEYYAAARKAAGSNGRGYAFDPVQNSDPCNAYFCGMALRVMRSLDYLKSRPEWDGRRLAAQGASMGGLQTIWAAALDPDVTEARPDIPWCCDMAGPSSGRAHGKWHVPWVSALGYYDPVNMASRMPATCRVDVQRAGLGDYICPPSGVMAFYNAMTCPKSIRLVQNSTHGYIAPPPRQTIELKEAGK